MLTHWLLAHLVKAITWVRSPELFFSTFATFKPPKPLFQVAVSKKSAEIPETQLFSIGSSNRLDRKSVLWKETDPELARKIKCGILEKSAKRCQNSPIQPKQPVSQWGRTGVTGGSVRNSTHCFAQCSTSRARPGGPPCAHIM